MEGASPLVPKPALLPLVPRANAHQLCGTSIILSSADGTHFMIMLELLINAVPRQASTLTTHATSSLCIGQYTCNHTVVGACSRPHARGACFFVCSSCLESCLACWVSGQRYQCRCRAGGLSSFMGEAFCLLRSFGSWCLDLASREVRSTIMCNVLVYSLSGMCH